MSTLRAACSDRTETFCKELVFALVKAFEEEEKGWGADSLPSIYLLRWPCGDLGPGVSINQLLGYRVAVGTEQKI